MASNEQVLKFGSGPLAKDTNVLGKDGQVRSSSVQVQCTVTPPQPPTGQANADPSKTEIISSVQLAIRTEIEKGLAEAADQDLLVQDFQHVDKITFPKGGSKSTPAHNFPEFKFRSYAPVGFRFFRKLFGIKHEDFLLSICNGEIREVSNPGGSGSFLFISRDDMFVIKSVEMKEADFLQELLSGYYMNLVQNPRTLLPKFFGLYGYKSTTSVLGHRFVIMNNFLPTVYRLHQKFDLKGSTHKRIASEAERQKSAPTLKDLDFLNEYPGGLVLDKDTYTALCKTIARDCAVLRNFKIMDYSLLLGVHNLDQAQKHTTGERSDSVQSSDSEHSLTRLTSVGSKGSTGKGNWRLAKNVLSAMLTVRGSIGASQEDGSLRPCSGIPAKNSVGERLQLFVGIVDIMQDYRLSKSLAHTWKSVVCDDIDTVSVQPPKFYAERFEQFMTKHVFTDNPDTKPDWATRRPSQSSQKEKLAAPLPKMEDLADSMENFLESAATTGKKAQRLLTIAAKDTKERFRSKSRERSPQN